jgi:hypothetical protein
MKKILTLLLAVCILLTSGCVMYEPVAGPVYMAPPPVIVVQPYYYPHYRWGYRHW